MSPQSQHRRTPVIEVTGMSEEGVEMPRFSEGVFVLDTSA